MLYSVATANLYFHPFERVLEIIAEAGFQYIELDMYWAGRKWAMAQHLKNLPVKRVVELVEKAGLRVSSIHDGSGLLENRHSTTGYINPTLDEYLSYLGYAPECLVFHTPHLEGDPGEGWWSEMSAEIVRSLEKYRKAASFITIENLPYLDDHFVPLLSPEELRAFVVENGLNATLDTTHYAQMGIDISGAARKLDGTIKTIHLSDYEEGKTHVFIGEGKLDLPGFLEVINKESLNAITLECSLTHPGKMHQEMTYDDLVSRLGEARVILEKLV